MRLVGAIGEATYTPALNYNLRECDNITCLSFGVGEYERMCPPIQTARLQNQFGVTTLLDP